MSRVPISRSMHHLSSAWLRNMFVYFVDMWSQTSDCCDRDIGSMPGKSMQVLWLTKWQWDRIFPCKSSFDRWSILTYDHFWRVQQTRYLVDLSVKTLIFNMQRGNSNTYCFDGTAVCYSGLEQICHTKTAVENVYIRILAHFMFYSYLSLL